MAAGTWQLYYAGIEGKGDGTIDLDNDVFKIALFTSSYTPSLSGDTTYSGLSNELASGNGYTTGGEIVAATWVESGGVLTFDVADPSWTASGGSLVFRYAVLYSSTADRLLGYCLLDVTPADITVPDSTMFVLTINANGIFKEQQV